MSKKIDVRADRIMRALLRAGDISVQELVEQIGTSAPSIRRDLARLKSADSCCVRMAARRW